MTAQRRRRARPILVRERPAWHARRGPTRFLATRRPCSCWPRSQRSHLSPWREQQTTSSHWRDAFVDGFTSPALGSAMESFPDPGHPLHPDPRPPTHAYPKMSHV